MPSPNPEQAGITAPGVLPATDALRVVVDLNLCQAYAQCCYAAPEHFVLRGREALHYDPAPSAASRDAVERARIACPVQAIQVEDAGKDSRKDSGKDLDKNSGNGGR